VKQKVLFTKKFLLSSMIHKQINHCEQICFNELKAYSATN